MGTFCTINFIYVFELHETKLALSNRITTKLTLITFYWLIILCSKSIDIIFEMIDQLKHA